MKHLLRKLLLCITGISFVANVFAGETQQSVEKSGKPKKAWEFGLGYSVFQFTRVGITSYTVDDDDMYHFNLDLRHVVHSGHIYVARELNKHFYVDFQGTLGATKRTYGSNDDYKFLGTAGLGLQWRLGGYFKSRYVDPYLRVGGAYMYKGFGIIYGNVETLYGTKPMEWILENINNKDGADRTHLIPIYAGLGINMWFNDRWGMAVEGDYLFMPYKHVANVLQGTARVLYRLGGDSKKPPQDIQYIDREVERIIEREVEVEVEKIVLVPAPLKELHGFFENIHFDFDRSDIVKESSESLDRIADVMLQDTTKRYLISGFTDIRGSSSYNQGLSERRAREVVQALIDRDVPAEMLKSRGAASRIALAPYRETHRVRRGDRKVTVELITNEEYWDFLTRAGF